MPPAAMHLLGAGMGSHPPPPTQVGRMERELELQIKQSLQETQALRENFENDLQCVRRDAERRMVERSRHSKKQQAKWKEQMLCVERKNADVTQRAELLQEQLVVSARELCIARQRIFQLESEAQAMRSSPPQVVERADPGAVVEVMRLRDKVFAGQEQARRAQRSAAEAQEALGREAAINQGLQRDVDNARHRLLTVQGSLAEASEENSGLRLELEGERVKAAAISRRLADAVDRHENALAEIRLDSTQLCEQRDRLAQDCAILGIKLHQSKKKQAAGRLLHVLEQARCCSLARAFRALAFGAARDLHSKQQARQREEYASEVASLEADLHGAETRCRDARHRLDLLRDSRETVAELAVSAYRRRRRGMMIAAAAEEGDDERRSTLVQRWCFWGWARVTQGGRAASARRARRADAERDLPGVREMLSAALERARGAEAERDRLRKTAEASAVESVRREAELEGTRAALEATQRSASFTKERFLHLGAARLHRTLQTSLQDRVASAFGSWNDAVSKSGDAEESEGDISAPAAPPEHDSGMSTVCRGIPSSPPPTALAGTASLHMGTPEAARKREAAKDLPATPMRSNASDEVAKTAGGGSVRERGKSIGKGSKNNGVDFVAERGEPPRNLAPVSVKTSDKPPMSRQQFSTWSDGLLDASLSVVAASREKINKSRGQDHGFDSFPFPARASTPASSTAPVIPTGRPADVTRNADANRRNSPSVVVPVPLRRPGGSGSSSWPANPDPARIMLGLREVVGEELYAAGERLLRCVEADHREVQGGPYRPIPITGAERDQFHACVEDAARGPLRRVVLNFLRVQDSYRAVAVERDREGVGGGRDGRRVGHARGGRTASCGGGGCDSGAVGHHGPGGVKRKGSTHCVEDRPHDLGSLAIGPLSSPAEKARAARVLRDLFVPLLSHAEDAWVRHRLQTTTSGLSNRNSIRKKISSSMATFKISTASTRQREKAGRRRNGNGNQRNTSSPSDRRSQCLDSGAGPRVFWEAMAGPRLVDASWKIDVKVLQQQLWDLAILVRGQDHHQPLRLRRRERLRRALDVRIYEILLVHVRTRLIWDGIDGDTGGGSGERNESTLEAGDVIGSSDTMMTFSGWDWLADGVTAAAH